MASLSVDDLGGKRYKIRWRELIAGPDGLPERAKDGRLKRRARSMTVVGKAARDEAVTRIRAALLDEGTYELPAAAEELVTNMERAAIGWLDWKRTRCTVSSVKRYTHHMARFFGAVRAVRKLPPEHVVYGEVLSRDLLVGVARQWQDEGLSESFVYGASRSALEMWRWVSDDPVSYPGVPVPPREAKAVLPRPPIYIAPPAPLLAETDACLRHLPIGAEQTRRIGVFLRFTGLRVRQVLSIRRRDLDLVNALLTVTAGKSRAEKAEARTVPIAKELVAQVRSWVEPLPPDALLFTAWGVVGSERPTNIRPDLFRAAWQEATKWGEAREIAWKPVNRLVGRPEHAFRSAFQAALRANGVAEHVIDVLVGHQGQTTRERHYVGHDSLMPAMRAAVDALPAIDWKGPKRGKVVPIRAAREREAAGG